MARTVFIDTWGWLALGHRRDPSHQQVKKLFQDLQQEGAILRTTDFVLDELATLLFRRELFSEAKQFMEALFSSAALNQLQIERIHSNRFAEGWRLRLRYHDKPQISFTDLTSMAVMQELGLLEVLTEDEHFTHVGLGFQQVP